MTDNQMKFLAAVLLFLAWAGAIAAKHWWPDIDTGGFVMAIISALTGLGIIHVKGNTP